MNRTHYVCFTCKTAIKRNKSDWVTEPKSVYCPHCGKRCKELSYKIPIPPKRKNKAWQQLHLHILTTEREQYGYDMAYLTHRKHDLEHRIAELEAKLTSKQSFHPQHIKQLRQQLCLLQTTLIQINFYIT